MTAKGYYVLRLYRTNKNGIPDLIAIPVGTKAGNTKVRFSEVKRRGKKPAPLQRYRIEELKAHGFEVEIYDGEVHDV